MADKEFDKMVEMKDKVICSGNSNHEKAYIIGNATNEIIPNGLIAKVEVKIENKNLKEDLDIEILKGNETVEKILQIIDFINKKYQKYAKEELQSGMIAKAFTAITNEIKIEIAKQLGVTIKE